MKKIFVLSMFFALFLAAGFGVQNGAVSLNVSKALADSGSHDRVRICHLTGNGSQTMSVDDSAVGGHIAHGDSMGRCDGDSNSHETVASYSCDCPPGISACTCADGSVGQASTDAPTAAGPMRQRSF